MQSRENTAEESPDPKGGLRGCRRQHSQMVDKKLLADRASHVRKYAVGVGTD